jgi:hypothetical protein
MIGGTVPNAIFCVPAYRAALKFVLSFQIFLGKSNQTKIFRTYAARVIGTRRLTLILLMCRIR